MKILGAIEGYSSVVMDSAGRMYIRIETPTVGSGYVPWYTGEDEQMKTLHALPDGVAEANETMYQALRAKESQK